MFSTKLLGAAVAIVLTANTSMAAYAVAAGKIKSVDAGDKSFVLTDSAEKDFTFKIGDNLVVNRAGKEGKSDLKTGDSINVCYEKGTLTWTAHYILIQEGVTKNCDLIRGTVKGYDAEKKEFAFTNENKKDTTYVVGDVTVKVNMEESKLENVKIGDQALLIVDGADGKSILRSVMVNRAK